MSMRKGQEPQGLSIADKWAISCRVRNTLHYSKQLENMDFENEMSVVTGARSGIGHALQ